MLQLWSSCFENRDVAFEFLLQLDGSWLLSAQIFAGENPDI